MEAIGLRDNTQVGIIVLDKLDKIGIENVLEEFKGLGLNNAQLKLLEEVVMYNNIEVLPETDLIKKGKEELAFIQSFNIEYSKLDVTLARGLDYYTGCIFEVVSNEYEIGSIGGGGRYDNLTEMFGKSDLTGVGISFGLDRIYDVIEGVNKFPEELTVTSKLLFVHFSEANQVYGFKALQEVRQHGISAEIYPDNANFKRQMKYANDKNIPFVVVCGDDEMKTGTYMLKNMETGEQKQYVLAEIIRILD
jgi:histidyl-tRNA synthetase